MHLGRIFLIGFFLSTQVFADYAWIPEYQQLQIRAGADAASTSSNYSDGGFSVAPTLSGQSVVLADRVFRIQPEFGIAQDWALGMRTGIVIGNADRVGSSTSLASGSGFGDSFGLVKWRVSHDPLLTLESYFKLPTGSSVALAATELVTGEGNFDLGLKVHYGIREGSFYFSASPGLLARFGGFSTAVTMDLAAQLFIHRAYGKLTVNSIFSLSPSALPPSTLASQTLAGTAGSYARLAASPTLVTTGATFGVLITKMFRVELGLAKTVWGQRAADSLIFTVDLLGFFDFAKPDLRPKVREVPFEGSEDDE